MVWRRDAPQRKPQAPRAAAQVNSRVRPPPKLLSYVPRSTLARTRAELNFSEEVADLPRRGIGRIRTMHDVLIDAVRKIGANRAFRRLLWISGAHHFAVLCDRALALEHLHHHRTRGHEAHQVLEKRPVAMHRVKSLRFRLRELHHSRGDHPQARLFKTAIHVADQVAADAVGFDDGKGTLDWHENLRQKIGESAPRRADKDREVYWSRGAQAIRTTAEVPVLLGKTRSASLGLNPFRANLSGRRQTLKLSPQPHSPLAFGFWNLKASFRPCLTKSTSVPSISGRLKGSTTTFTPRASKTESSGKISSA